MWFTILAVSAGAGIGLLAGGGPRFVAVARLLAPAPAPAPAGGQRARTARSRPPAEAGRTGG